MADKFEVSSPPRVDRGGDVTADDMVISHSAYTEEIQAALERTEEAFKAGDYAKAARLAGEGLAAIRISVPKLGAHNVPPYYAAFFRCFQMHEAFGEALRLYKHGVAHPGERLHGQPDRDALAQAWKLLEPKVASLNDELPVERLVFEFPVAGRLLRAVVRLRDKLRSALAIGDPRC